MNVGLWCYGNGLWLQRDGVFFRLSLTGRPVQGLLQLLVIIHLCLKEATYTISGGLREKILGESCDAQ